MRRRASVYEHLQSYGVGLLAAAAAVGARVLLGQATGLVYITFYPAIVASGWWGGLGPALLTTGLCGLAANHIWLSPSGGLSIASPQALVGWLLFLAVGGLLATLSAGFRRAQGRLQAMVDAMGDGFVAIDRRWRYTYVNAKFGALVEMRPAALVGRSVWDVFPALEHAPFGEAARRAMTEGSAEHLSEFYQPLGRWYEVDIYPSIDGIVIFSRDVSAAREMEQRRAALLAKEQEAREQLEAANRSKDEFLATLSHELRTPLNAVMGWAQMLGSRAAGASADRAVAAIERNAALLKQLVDDLLDVSRIVSGKLQFDMQAVDIGRVVRDAIEVVRPSAEARRCALDLVAPDEPLWVMGDAARLRQAVWNLLSNAVKFTPAGGRIDVRVAQEGSTVEVHVRDTGIGMAPDLLPRVFDRFVQAESGIARSAGGLGLGLAIARHVVEASGGTITASSAGPNQGSTFVVVLPVHSTLVEAPVAADTAIDRGDVLKGRHILVLENDEDARRLLAGVLEQHGAAVVESDTVAAAAESLSKQPLDVVIADLALGGETGFEVAPHVRAAEAVHGRPVGLMAVTAYSDESLRARARDAGFHAYLIKPWQPRELLDAIGTVLAGATRT